MEHEAFATTVMSVATLLFSAAVSALVTRRIRFPYTIGLVIIGLAVAFIAYSGSRIRGHPLATH